MKFVVPSSANFPVRSALSWFVKAAGIAMLVCLTAACRHNKEEKSAVTVYQALLAQPQFSIFASLLDESGLKDELLEADTGFTVFAPNEEGFPYFPPEVLAVLAQTLSPEALEQFVLDTNWETLQSYIFETRWNFIALYGLNDKTVQSLNAQTSEVWIDDEGLKIGGALVVEKNIHVANGIIHVVGRPILTLAE